MSTWWSATRKTALVTWRFYPMPSEIPNGPHHGTETDAKRAESHALRYFPLTLLLLATMVDLRHKPRGRI